ncbi:MAG: glycerophosphodiester phosphodiesterase, partial [Woeseiaceae bacterium]
LPEHTLPAKALAYAMGADYLEQDVVATRDDELVVLHDIHLDRVSNVADVYAGRARVDGRYYVRDFDLDELRTLSVWERMNEDGSRVYPDRFPARSGNFRIHTFADELELVRSLNAATGGTTGVYPEIKSPAWHKEEGVDISPLFLDVLADHGYGSREEAVYVQCFDDAELRRVRHELGCELKLVQLIGENDWGESATDYEAIRTPAGLKELAKTVDGIGPWLNQLYVLEGVNTTPRPTGLVASAHEAGLVVHPYTFRLDSLPEGFESLDALLDFMFDELRVDGVFTDFPDQVHHAVRARS